MAEPITARELLEVKSSTYAPPPGHRGSMQEMGLPNFTLRTVEQMRRDSHVKLGWAIKQAPLMHIKFDCTGRPDVMQFAQQQMTSAWDAMISKVSTALIYRLHASEPIYRRNQHTGLMEFTGCNDFYPADVDFLEQQRRLIGLRVRRRGATTNTNDNLGFDDYYGMKSFIYIHGQEFGSREGMSELEAAYPPWLAKVGPDGAYGVRNLWFYKNAFHSGILFHPPGEYQYVGANGAITIIPYRDLARQAMERSQSGAVWAFPMVVDEKSGKPLWEYHEPRMNGDGKPMLDYVEQLNTEIMRGMGIPDDIISQTSGTGSYAGRSIPFQAFLTSQDITVKAIFSAIEKQIIANLCQWNFGSRDFEFHGVQIDRDRLLPPDSPPGGAPPAGQPQDPSQPQPNPMAAGVMQQAVQNINGGAPMQQSAIAA